MYTYDDPEQYWIHVLVPLWSYDRPIQPQDNCSKLPYANFEHTNGGGFKIDIKGRKEDYKYYAVHRTLNKLNFKRDMPDLMDRIGWCKVLWGNYFNNPEFKQKHITSGILRICALNGYVFAEIVIKCEDEDQQSFVIELCNETYAELQEIYSNKSDENKKGNNSMANLFGNIKVGKAGSRYSLTYFGTIAYNGKSYYNGTIYDATGMTINFDMLYLIPATEVKKGDIIERQVECSTKAYYVTAVENGVVKAIDLEAGTEESIIPGGPFGMQLYSKLFNPMGNMQGENAFGNILMMQALMGDSKSADNGMLMAMMMMQGGFKFPTFEMPKPAAEKPAAVENK